MQLDLFNDKDTATIKNEATFNEYQKFVTDLGNSEMFEALPGAAALTSFLLKEGEGRELSSKEKSRILKSLEAILYHCAKISNDLNTDMEVLALRTINKLQLNENEDM